MTAMAQVREQALEHVLETLCSSSADVQSCLRLASTNKALNLLVDNCSFWQRFFAEAVEVRCLREGDQLRTLDHALLFVAVCLRLVLRVGT